MGFLFARKTQSSSNVPEFTGLQIQTSSNSLPIPIIWGSPRVSCNIFYANDFKSVHTKASGGSGKGLFSSGSGKGGSTATDVINYFATFTLGLGEGPLGDIIEVYEDQSTYSLAGWPAPMTYFNGGTGQAPWSYLTTAHPGDDLSYSDFAYLGASNYQISSSATIQQFNFLIKGLFQGSSPLNKYTTADSTYSGFLDADWAFVLDDFLTRDRYGVGFPGSLIDPGYLSGPNATVMGTGDAAFQTYCQAQGLGCSYVLNSSEQASSIIDRWMKLTNTALVWTGAILKFIPYGDTYLDGNPGYDASSGLPLKYYNPASLLTVQFALTDDDFVQSKDATTDPVTYERSDVADAYNAVTMGFRDRANLSNSNIVEVKDENAVELYGTRADNFGEAHEFGNVAYAQIAAQSMLVRNIGVRNRYTFKLSWEYCILDPMDVVTIPDPAGAGTVIPVRVVTIEEDDKYELTVVAEELSQGTSNVPVYPKQSNVPATILNAGVVPGSVNTPFIFEPTSTMMTALGQAQPSITVGLSAGPAGVYDQNFGGADVYISLDNVTYAFQGRFTGKSTMGVLTASLASYGGANPDTGSTLKVDLTESNGTLSSVTSGQAAAGNLNLCAVINGSGALELISFETATLTAPNKYTLTNLWRAQFGTTAISATTGDQFLFLSNNLVYQQVLPAQYVGVLLYFKFLSFNQFNNAEQALSDVAVQVYQFTPAGSGSGPGTAPGYPIYSIRVVTTNTNIVL